MTTKKIVKKEEEKIHSQEKYARENFAGMDGLGKEILRVTKEAKKNLKDYIESRKNEEKNEDYYNAYHEIKQEASKKLDILFTVLSIKMSTSMGHAVNGNSTKTLKDIIRFMDKYSIGDKLFKGDMARLASRRHISSSDFVTVCAIVAAKADDLEFIKELELFAKKNEGRENIYIDIVSNGNISFGEMSGYGMTAIRDIGRVTFEALVNGSEKVYEYYVTTGALKPEYIKRHIAKSNNSWENSDRLTKAEVVNVLKLEPGLITDIIEHMPEKLPQEITDIFIF